MITLQVDLADRQQVNEFLEVPFRLYKSISQWVPSLQGDERRRLDPKKNPFYKHSSAAFFLARENGRTLGRLAVLDPFIHNEHNQTETAFFFMFECENNPDAASELFSAGFDWARKRGRNKMIGPKGFTALDGLGLLVKGFELRPAFGLPYNPSYYAELVEAQGFIKSGEIVSGYLDAKMEFPARIHELSARVQAHRGLHIARFHSRGELRAALGNLKVLYNETLQGTSGGTPITEEEFATLVNQMIWFADPNLVKIVMKEDRPVGFLLAYPDVSAALQRTRGKIFPFGWLTILRELKETTWININGAGMVKEYQGLGGTAILFSEMFKSVQENPRYLHAEVVQVGMENDKMQREMENFGINFIKIHRLYEREL